MYCVLDLKEASSDDTVRTGSVGCIVINDYFFLNNNYYIFRIKILIFLFKLG